MNTRFATIAAAVIALGFTAAPLVANATNDHHPVATLHHRVVRQNTRVREGVRTGKLTRAQAALLHARDRRIQKSIISDRRHHGGRLTAAEHARLERRLNASSHVIARKKH